VAVCLAALSIIIPQGMVFAQDNTSCEQIKWKVTVYATGYPQGEVYYIWASTAQDAKNEGESDYMRQYPRRTITRTTVDKA
jgi:hypothetical protein